LIFVDGDQQLDRRHMLKLFGLIQLPAGVQFSGRFQVLSGLPIYTNSSGGVGATGARFVRFTRQQYPAIRTTAFIDVPGEPQGSLRLDSEITLDLRVDKKVTFTKGINLDVMLDVFNVLNANTVTRVQSLNTALTNFLRAGEILNPRAAQFGVRLSF
jgi:hypothetical protein